MTIQMSKMSSKGSKKMSLLDDYKDGWLENLKRPTMMNCVSSVCFHFLIHPELLTIDDEDNETAIKI